MPAFEAATVVTEAGSLGVDFMADSAAESTLASAVGSTVVLPGVDSMAEDFMEVAAPVVALAAATAAAAGIGNTRAFGATSSANLTMLSPAEIQELPDCQEPNSAVACLASFSILPHTKLQSEKIIGSAIS